MVSFKTLTTATAALVAAPLSSAYITRIEAPAEAHAGDNVTVTLGTAIYIQNWDDLSIAWGLASPQWGGLNSDGNIYIGTKVDYTVLYPDNLPDTSKNSFTVDVQIPEGQAAGEYLLVAAVPYIVAASGMTAVRSFNSTINITA
ncbi:hypothetical protein F5X99DRAFT_401892 [Biscogniauxia marginata]|nr:hypothetical protein F5X99DRAFT_401892 [Biscogniauxia marginata]